MGVPRETIEALAERTASGLRSLPGRGSVSAIAALPAASRPSLAALGLALEDSPGGAFVLRGGDAYLGPSRLPGVELLPLAEALARYPEVRERYYFKALPADHDGLVAALAAAPPRGYFMRVREGVIVDEPVYAGFLMEEEGSVMGAHNVIVAEPGSRLTLVAGCASGRGAESGLHLSVDEQYVGRGASLGVTMIHEWGAGFTVAPRSATVVEEDGAYYSDYCAVRPPLSIDSSPLVRLAGPRATTRQTTVVVGMPGTRIDIGGLILMEGEYSSAELVSRTANYGGDVIQAGLLVGAAKGSRGHVDCSGLILGDSGTIEAVPGLRTLHPDARMSHEAAIGRVDRGELQYLGAKGLDESEATALIVRGFLDAGGRLESLAPGLRARIREVAALSGHGEA